MNLRHGALRYLVLAGTALAACLATNAFAAVSSWSPSAGLDATAGTINVFAYGSPPNQVYAGTEGQGVYRSDNGGASWFAFNPGLDTPDARRVRSLLVQGTTVYAGTAIGVFVSTTGGTWQPLAQGAEPVPGTISRLNGSVLALALDGATH
jgi:hypothetical protein